MIMLVSLIVLLRGLLVFLIFHMVHCIYMYVGDGFITRPVLKPSGGFKVGPMASNLAGQLDIGPNGFKTF